MLITKFKFHVLANNTVKDVFAMSFRTPATTTVLNDETVLSEELFTDGTLLQSTGLKNLGGADIYEGDVYEVEGYGVGSVVIDPLFGTVIQRKDGSQITMLHILQLDLDYTFLGDYSQKDTIRFYNHELTDN